MKLKKQMNFMAIWIALGLLIPLMAIEGSNTVNLIENPSFEVDDDQDGLPDCWCLISNYPNFLGNERRETDG